MHGCSRAFERAASDNSIAVIIINASDAEMTDTRLAVWPENLPNSIYDRRATFKNSNGNYDETAHAELFSRAMYNASTAAAAVSVPANDCAVLKFLNISIFRNSTVVPLSGVVYRIG